jgi:hypothetical protein
MKLWFFKLTGKDGGEPTDDEIGRLCDMIKTARSLEPSDELVAIWGPQLTIEEYEITNSDKIIICCPEEIQIK